MRRRATRRAIDWLRGAARSRDVRWTAALCAVALAVRLALVLSAGRTHLGLGDPLFYHLVATSLANGDGFAFFGNTTVHWPPGYPFALAGVYRVFGADVTHGLVLGAFLGAAAVPLAYLTALRVAGRAAAIAVAAALALLPGQALIAGVLLAENLYTLELVAFVALAATLAPRPRSLVVLGVLASAAALTRGEGLLLPVVVLGMAWAPGERRAALRRAAIVAAVMLAVVAPWTVRNALAVHAFVPVATNASETLWSGHNPAADGGPVYAIQRNALRRVSSQNYEVSAAAELRRQAFSYAVHHPLRELELIPLKLRSLVRGDSELIRVWINSRGQRPLGRATASVVGTLADVAWYTLLTGTLVTIAVFGRELWRVPLVRGVLAFLALAIPLYGFVYYGNFRYRLPLEPLMLLVLASALVGAGDRARSARIAA